MNTRRWKSFKTNAYEAGIVLAMLGGCVLYLLDESVQQWRENRKKKNVAYNQRSYAPLPKKEEVIAASTKVVSEGKPAAPELPPLN